MRWHMNTGIPIRIVLGVTASILICLLLYGGSFVLVFDVFGFPVHGSEGWLGPARRGDPQLVDIGKIYDYEGDDLSLYRAYRPLCRLWLSFNGLT
jgi:hypothetical protein